MIKLVVDDSFQKIMVDSALNTLGIRCDVVVDDKKYGIRPPYTIVDGVPLDMTRIMKLIVYKEMNKNA